MTYRSTRDAVEDLAKAGRLIQCDEPLSPFLEIAEVQRRVYASHGPAILFTNPRGCRFPMVGNLFGSLDQSRFLFRKTLERVRRAIELKIEPTAFFSNPWRYSSSPWVAWSMLPKRVRRGPIQAHEIGINELPQLTSWPKDGGPFVTLPQVISQSVHSFKLTDCNLGMYRIQLGGNDYDAACEVGLHYQIHRGIGIHHQQSLSAGRSFPVNVFVGGSPAMTIAAVMPLPEGLSELTFAGALAGHRIPMICGMDHAPIYADADFCLVGEVDPTRQKPEGPFGDHLGYYSLQHEFPVLRIKRVYHRPGAIWPFTVVGRPPQEDTTFGELIHELTGPIIPSVLPGVKAVHAVDAAGVHPLLLAIGSERYTPYRNPERPQELLTQANAILGQGQLSLAKYLMIVNQNDSPSLDIHHVEDFITHLLERIRWTRDLHFQTRTTIDTLDYSGTGMNQGSKVIMAASGPRWRTLATSLPLESDLPIPFRRPKLCLPGVLALEVAVQSETSRLDSLKTLEDYWLRQSNSDGIACIVLVDDSEFTSKSLNNFLWITFTRSNPASDIHGVQAFVEDKHWGCRGPLIIDACRKPHHAPALMEDQTVTTKIDALAARGGPLARFL